MRFVNTKTIIPLIIVIALLLLIKNILNSIATLNKNSKILTDLKEQELSAKREQQFLKERLYYVQTNEFIEKEAREKLGMVKSGEQIILLPQNEEKIVQQVKKESVPNWEKWKRLFF